MKRTLFAACALTFTLSAAAQSPEPAALPPLTSIADARKLADKSIALFQQKKHAEGYDVLEPYWPLPAVEIDNLAHQTATQWPIVEQRFGASLGTEFVIEQKVGSSFVRFVYLQKFERHAIRWIFIFYKPSDRWIVNSFSFDDTVSALFE